MTICAGWLIVFNPFMVLVGYAMYKSMFKRRGHWAGHKHQGMRHKPNDLINKKLKMAYAYMQENEIQFDHLNINKR